MLFLLLLAFVRSGRDLGYCSGPFAFCRHTVHLRSRHIFDLLNFLHFLVCHLSQAGMKLVFGRAGICQFCLVCYVPFGLKRWKAHWEQDIMVAVGPFP